MRYLCLFLFFASPLAAFQLHYPVDETVAQTYTTVVSITQEGPGVQLDTRAEQIIDLEITREAEDRLTLVFRRLQVDLQGNGAATHYDSKLPGLSPAMAEFASLIDRPIGLVVDGKGKLKRSPDIDQLSSELPLAAEMLPPAFFQQLSQQLFALAEEEIIERGSYKPDNLLAGVVDHALEYRISGIVAGQVRATFRGEQEPQDVDLGTLSPTSQTGQGITLSLSGRSIGEATWNKDNALKAEIHCSSFYRGSIKQKGSEFPVSVTVDSRLESENRLS